MQGSLIRPYTLSENFVSYSLFLLVSKIYRSRLLLMGKYPKLKSDPASLLSHYNSLILLPAYSWVIFFFFVKEILNNLPSILGVLYQKCFFTYYPVSHIA